MASPPEQVVPFRDLKHMETLVIGLQGNPVSLATPDPGDSLVWDGTEWAPVGLRLGISEADADTRYIRQSGGLVTGTLIFPGPTTGIDINDGSLHLTRSDFLMSGNTGLERIALSRTGSAAIEGIPIQWSDSGSPLARIGAGRGAPGGNQGYVGVQVYNLINASWLNAWTTRQTGGQAWLQVYTEPVQPFDVATKQYVDGMVTEGSTVLIGVFEPDTDTCHYRTDLPYLNPGPLVPPDVAGAGAYLICDEAGTFPPASEAAGLTFVIGDWVISDGTDWVKLSVGTPNLSASAIAVFPNVAGQDNVQSALEAMLPLSGGQMEGPLELAANAAQPLQPVPLQQLTSTLAGYLPLIGGILTGNLTINRSDAQLHINSIGNGSRATVFWGSDTNNHFGLFRNNGATSLQLDRYDDAGTATGVLAVNRNTGAVALMNNATLTLTGDAVFPLQPVTLQQGNARYFPFTGGTFTGPVTLAGDAAQPLNPVPLRQLDARIAALPPNVSSFNTRSGAVTLTTADITGAGGAPINAPTFTGLVSMTAGLSFGSVAVNSAIDLTRHIALWGGLTPTAGGFGFSVTSGTLNYVVSATTNIHDFYASTTLLARLNNSGLVVQGTRDVTARAFHSSTDNFGLEVSGGGWFYKKTGTGVVIRQSSGNQQPQIENNDGSGIRVILDTNNGVARAGSTMTGTLNMNGNFITNLANPGNATGDAANKGYVDNQNNTRVPIAGGTMTGSLVFNGTNLGVSWGVGASPPWGRIYSWSDKPITITMDSANRQPRIANNDGSSARDILDANNGVGIYGATMVATLVMTKPGTTNGEMIRLNRVSADMQYPHISYRVDGALRWNLEMTNNAASDWQIARWNDAGVFQDHPMVVSRANGRVTLNGPPVAPNEAATKGYVDASITAGTVGPWVAAQSVATGWSAGTFRARWLFGPAVAMELRGTAISNGTIEGSQAGTAITLPVGYRPATAKSFLALTNNAAAGTWGLIRVNYATNNFALQMGPQILPVTGPTTVYLENVILPLDNI